MSLRKLLVSPYGATIFPIFLLIVAFLFPPTVYSYYVKEPNYMFLNLKMLSFGLLCTFFYYIGLFISNFKSVFRFNFSMLKISVSNFTYIGMIAFLTIILQIIYFILLAIYLFKASGLGLFNVVFTGRGEIFKYAFRELRIPFGLGAIPTVIVGFEFWLLYKMYELKNSTLINTFMNKKYRLLKFFIILSVILCILQNMITVSRSGLIILVVGWFVIYLYFNKDKVLPNLIKIFLFIIGIFVLTSIIRWAYSAENITDMVIEKFLGYTIADFNRMSLMIDGKLSYVDAGIPGILYIFPVFKIPLTQIIFFDLLELSYLSLSAVANAGLNGSYNMATLFGGIYQVIGIMTPIYFFFLGYIGARLFQAFKKEKNFGVVLYPLFYVSVALWMVDLNFFILNFLYYFYAVIALVVYTSLFKVNRAK